jgi:hypothetical protein
MSRLAISALVVCLAACGDDSESTDFSQLLKISRRVVEKVCACSSDADCLVDEARVACAHGVLRRHESELTEYAACARDTYVELEACIDDARCNESIILDCVVELEPAAVCEPLPAGLDDRIEDEIDDECPADIECDSGATARGNYCNGNAECADGSDELDCSRDEEQFTCLNGTEVAVSYVCDGVDDCRDNSDENPAQCSRSR